MPCSPARLAANRANARKSTGPKTEAGKARSRENAYKHGLTGEGVVLPTEDAGRVAGRFVGLMEEFAPGTLMGGILVKRAAMLSVRLDRCYEQEAANLSARVLSAGSDLVDKRKAEAEHLLRTIGAEPATNSRRLMATPEGVEQMIAKWEGMKADLDHAEGCRWTYAHSQLADNLHGRDAGLIDVTPYMAWTMAIRGDYQYLRPDRLAGLKDDDAKALHAMNQIADLVDADIARLRAHRLAMDTSAVDAERATAPARALFDTSKDAVLARKYEAAAERGLYRALQELRQVEAEAAEDPPIATAPADGEPEVDEQEEIEAEEPGAMGSFFPAGSDRSGEAVAMASKADDRRGAVGQEGPPCR